VKLATVHTSKGLQWLPSSSPGWLRGAVTGLPGPARLSTRWTDNPRLLPFGLRGDATDLPDLRTWTPARWTPSLSAARP